MLPTEGSREKIFQMMLEWLDW